MHHGAAATLAAKTQLAVESLQRGEGCIIIFPRDFGGFSEPSFPLFRISVNSGIFYGRGRSERRRAGSPERPPDGYSSTAKIY
jgi:hypothetical protein